MLKKMWFFVVSCWIGIAANALAEPGDLEKGKVSYALCLACHGVQAEGNKALNSPRLAGQEAWYLKNQLLKFRNDIRGNDAKDMLGMQMAPMAKVLANKGAIDDVVAYIRTLKPTMPPDASKGDAGKGKILYATCAACHGAQGEGNVAQKAPRLIGQHAWYMKRQIHNFKDGLRGAHPKDVEGKMMMPMAMLLPNDQAIDDVITYIQSLGR